MAIRIGTSGWHYPSWWGPFFPEGLRKKDALSYYATRFATTELNAPFYRTPTLEAVTAWAEQTPEDFVFAWKASRFITHWKRLSQKSSSSLDLMESRLERLGDKLGPVLLQLPARMQADRERLAAFLGLLRPQHRYAFEFRHASWYRDSIFELLAGSDAALCISDHGEAPAPWHKTASFVYVRGHGPSGRYFGNYSDAMLQRWARLFRRWNKAKVDVYCYFDNDQKSAAPADAERLMKMVKLRRK